MAPELTQHTVVELLTPQRAATRADPQPALLRLGEQLRDTRAAGHPLGETQRVIALRGILPQTLLGRLGDLESLEPAHSPTL